LIDPIGKKEAMRLLSITPATIGRWMASGKLKFERDATAGQYAPCFFERADVLAFVPVLPTVGFEQAAPALEPKRNAAPAKVGSYEDAPAEPTFAEKFKAGEATDSMGNDLFKPNPVSLLGPVVVDRTPPAPAQSHMDPKLLSDYVDPHHAPLVSRTINEGQGFTRSGEPLAHGLSQETYDGMMADWRRSGGGRSESEMEQQIRRSKAAINAAFKR
jgi:hypothetical protein